MTAPLAINTADGSCWTRRTVTSGGIALYALADVCSCPEFVMATEAELAERGIVGCADALPMPAGPVDDEPIRTVEGALAALGPLPETQQPEHGPLWSLLDWSLWGAGMGDLFREALADRMLAAIPARGRAHAEQLMAEFIERRRIEKTGVTVYQEQRDELEGLRARVAELEAVLERRDAHAERLATLLVARTEDLTAAQESPLAFAEQLDAKSLDNFLIALASATEYEPMDGAVDEIHKLIASYREPGVGEAS